jgi:biotin operon repressor
VLETSVRLLRLLSLLQQRQDWSGAELATRLEVSTRTVRNEVDRLRQLVYQVDSATGPAGGYRTCELLTGTDSLHDLAAYLSKFDVPFTVLDPPELRDLLLELAARYTAAGGDGVP